MNYPSPDKPVLATLDKHEPFVADNIPKILYVHHIIPLYSFFGLGFYGLSTKGVAQVPNIRCISYIRIANSCFANALYIHIVSIALRYSIQYTKFRNSCQGKNARTRKKLCANRERENIKMYARMEKCLTNKRECVILVVRNRSREFFGFYKDYLPLIIQGALYILRTTYLQSFKTKGSIYAIFLPPPFWRTPPV